MSNVFAESDNRSKHFLRAVSERASLIVGHSGSRVRLEEFATSYVLPGVRMELTDNAARMVCWIGVNEHRLFYIQRVAAPKDRSKEIFEFAFGGASKVGWTFTYEPIGEGNETSIWGTAETNVAYTVPTGETFRIGDGPTLHNLDLTEAGAFWANDIAMMMQSAFRSAQRNALRPGAGNPEPL